MCKFSQEEKNVGKKNRENVSQWETKKKKKGYTIRHGIHFVEWRRKTFFFSSNF